jgi:hypothetical protein
MYRMQVPLGAEDLPGVTQNRNELTGQDTSRQVLIDPPSTASV